MHESTELTITIKGADASYKQKFLLDVPYTISMNDPTIKACVGETLANSKIEPEDIIVRVLLVLK